MFFLRSLEREISIHPSFLGANIHDFLTKKLYEDMEGSCNGEFFIICIMDIQDISLGKVRPGTGVADFTILYRAILWKPFKGEVVRLTLRCSHRCGTCHVPVRKEHSRDKEALTPLVTDRLRS